MLRVRTNFTGLTGAPYLTTHYFGGTNESDATSAVVAVAAFYEACKVRINSNLTWAVSGEVASIDEVTGDLVDVFSVGDSLNTGTDSNDGLPFTSQGLIRWGTSNIVSGRRLRGRTFMPGPTEGYNTAGRPTATYGSTVGPAAAALIADADTTLLVWSKTHGVAHEVTGYSVWNQWAELRSRRD